MSEAVANSRDKALGAGVIDPELPIIDCHHHLWHPHAERYLVDSFHADIAASGHLVEATVYIECSAMLRPAGPEHLRAAGEAEFAAGMAAMSESGVFGPARACAGYVGAADLRLGDRVEEALDALQTASGGRLRGIRGTANWDADAGVNTGTRPMAPRGLLADPDWREGVKRLARRGLAYDAWQYYPQTDDLCALADACPGARIVIDHCGGLLGVRGYATPDNFFRWKARMAEAARRPNFFMKLGGLAGGRNGFGYAGRQARPSLDDLVADWKPYIETLIELFGPNRCMFESNWPVDAAACDYRTLWNVFKTIANGASDDERAMMFSRNAAAFYRLGEAVRA